MNYTSPEENAATPRDNIPLITITNTEGSTMIKPQSPNPEANPPQAASTPTNQVNENNDPGAQVNNAAPTEETETRVLDWVQETGTPAKTQGSDVDNITIIGEDDVEMENGDPSVGQDQEPNRETEEGEIVENPAERNSTEKHKKPTTGAAAKRRARRKKSEAAQDNQSMQGDKEKHNNLPTSQQFGKETTRENQPQQHHAPTRDEQEKGKKGKRQDQTTPDHWTNRINMPPPNIANIIAKKRVKREKTQQ